MSLRYKLLERIRYVGGHFFCILSFFLSLSLSFFHPFFLRFVYISSFTTGIYRDTSAFSLTATLWTHKDNKYGWKVSLISSSRNRLLSFSLSFPPVSLQEALERFKTKDRSIVVPRLTHDRSWKRRSLADQWTRMCFEFGEHEQYRELRSRAKFGFDGSMES